MYLKLITNLSDNGIRISGILTNVINIMQYCCIIHSRTNMKRSEIKVCDLVQVAISDVCKVKFDSDK